MRTSEVEGHTPKVFICWSGNHARSIATEIRDGIEKYFRLDCYFSEQEERGKDWFDELRSALRQCTFSLIIITPEGLASDWLLWEAGALWNHYLNGHPGSQQVRLCPVLIGITVGEIPDPIRRFACTEFARADGESAEAATERMKQAMCGLCESMNGALVSPYPKEVVNAIALRFWDSISNSIIEAATRASLSIGDVKYLEKRVDLKESLGRMLVSNSAAPIYQMDDDYTIISANLAAQILFDLPRSGSVTLEEFLARVKSRVINWSEVEHNLQTEFLGAHAPRVHSEPIEYVHPYFGKISLVKHASHIPETDGVSWIVAFHIMSMDSHVMYLQELQAQYRGIVFAAWERHRHR